jgi:hypothetical protein
MNSNSLQRRVWVSLAITIAFVVATILLVSIPASRFASAAAREYAAGIARVNLALLIILIWRWNRAADALKSASPRSWAIVLPVALYSLIVLSASIYWHVTLEPRSAEPGCRRRF